MTAESTNPDHAQPSETGKPSETKALSELSGPNQIHSNTLPAERLQTILKQISDGYYDRPDVLDETVKRAVEDL